MVIRYLLVVFVTASISACGFHLRGQIPVPDSLNVIAVKTTDRNLQRSLVEALSSNGATVVQDSSQAKALLDLHKVEFDRQVLTIDDRGKVTGYRLIYRVAFRVTTATGESLRTSTAISRRDFNFDPDLVLQKEIEENALREDMLIELTQTIMRQLSTIVAITVPNHFAVSKLRFLS